MDEWVPADSIGKLETPLPLPQSLEQLAATDDNQLQPPAPRLTRGTSSASSLLLSVSDGKQGNESNDDGELDLNDDRKLTRRRKIEEFFRTLPKVTEA